MALNKIVSLTKDAYEKLKSDQYLQGIDDFNKALELSTKAQQSQIIEKCSQNLAAAQIESSNEHDITRAVKLLQQTNGDKKDGNESNLIVYYNVAFAFYKLKEYDKAESFYELFLLQLKISHRNIHDDNLMYNLCLNLSNIYKRKKKWLDVARIFKTSSTYMSSNIYQIVFLLETARILLDCKQKNDCYSILEECLQKSSSLQNNYQMESKVKIEIGLLFTQLEVSNKEIIQCFKSARAAAKRCDDRRLLAISSQNLGAILNKNQQYETSIRFHREALENYNFEKLDQQRCYMDVILNLSQSYYKTNKIDECKKFLVQVLEKVSNQRHQFEIYGRLITIYYVTNDFISLHNCLNKAKDIAPQDKKIFIEQQLATIEKINQQATEAAKILPQNFDVIPNQIENMNLRPGLKRMESKIRGSNSFVPNAGFRSIKASLLSESQPSTSNFTPKENITEESDTDSQQQVNEGLAEDENADQQEVKRCYKNAMKSFDENQSEIDDELITTMRYYGNNDKNDQNSNKSDDDENLYSKIGTAGNETWKELPTSPSLPNRTYEKPTNFKYGNFMTPTSSSTDIFTDNDPTYQKIEDVNVNSESLKLPQKKQTENNGKCNIS